MSGMVPIPGPLSAEPTAPPQSLRKTRSPILAALFSAFLPGAGQLFLGQRGKAYVLVTLFAILLAAFWPLRLLRFYAGFVGLYSAWTGLYLYAASSAQLGRSLPSNKQPSRWWLLATLPLALFPLSLTGAAVTRASGFRSFSIPSTSMEKTLRQGDHFVVDLHSRVPQHQDVVIFFRNQTYFVKRVAAVAGDSIQGRGGMILLNGKEIDEPYVEHIGNQPTPWMSDFGPITIPRGKCFVLGDNRDVSLDSRSPEFGLVDTASIIGKALYVFGSDSVGRSIR